MLIIWIILFVTLFLFVIYFYKKENFEIITTKDRMVAVSGFWLIKNKHSSKDFLKWFKNTVNINCYYVFFGNDESINIIKKYRNPNYPTKYINLEIDKFETYKYYNNIIMDSKHCPSKELGLVWLEKIFLMRKVKNMIPSKYYIWIDAGCSSFRNKEPSVDIFPNNLHILDSYSSEKFYFSTSESNIFEPNKVGSNNYYHYIAGTAFVISGSFVDKFADMYEIYLNNTFVNSTIPITDQIIFTKMYKDNPHFFKKIASSYGNVVTNLMYESKKTYIPLNIFQVWIGNQMPIKMQELINKIQYENPEFSYKCYSNDDCIEFLKTNFNIEILNTYHILIPGSYKSDLMRFALLYKYGGIYIDTKMEPVNGFKFITLTDKNYYLKDKYINFISSYTGTIEDISTQIIVSEPNTKILENCINQIVVNVKNKFYGIHTSEVTGPGVLHKALFENNIFSDSSEISVEHTIDPYCIEYQKNPILKINNVVYNEQVKNGIKSKTHVTLWNEKNIFSK
jgi:hypothetical protein